MKKKSERTFETPRRNRESPDIPPSKTKSGQLRFLHRAVNIWNNLDEDFKQLSLTSF